MKIHAMQGALYPFALTFAAALMPQSALAQEAAQINAPQTTANQTTSAPADRCSAFGGLLAGSGLCRSEAFAQLPMTRRNAWVPAIGCDTAAQEAALPGGAWLLYAAQRCGERIAQLETTAGERGALVLRYTAAARNKALPGKIVLTLVQGQPSPYAAISALALMGLDKKQLRYCNLHEPDVEGYPIDAYVFDLVPGAPRKLREMGTPCGIYGRSGNADGYWRIFAGYGFYFAFGDDQPEFDPASFAVYRPGG